MIAPVSLRRTTRPEGSPRAFATAILLVLALAASAFARSTPEIVPDVRLSSLPQEAQQVFDLIGQGGPFRYSRDGVIFGNRERLLPLMPRGYYHEYTVRTPGARDRGARRIICGGPKRALDVCYYTDDHYQSFRRIHP